MTKPHAMSLEGALLSVNVSIHYLRLAFKQARDAGLPGVMTEITTRATDLDELRAKLEELLKTATSG